MIVNYDNNDNNINKDLIFGTCGQLLKLFVYMELTLELTFFIDKFTLLQIISLWNSKQTRWKLQLAEQSFQKILSHSFDIVTNAFNLKFQIPLIKLWGTFVDIQLF